MRPDSILQIEYFFGRKDSEPELNVYRLVRDHNRNIQNIRTRIKTFHGNEAYELFLKLTNQMNQPN